MSWVLAFEEKSDHPYAGCKTFVANFSKAMQDNPSVRPAFKPFVDEIALWCVERFGPGNNKTSWDYSAMGTFYFEDEAEAFEFKMRWC